MQNLVRNVCNMWQCLKQTTVDLTVCCLTVFISLSLIDTLVRRAGMRHPQPPLVPQNLKELPTTPIQQLKNPITACTKVEAAAEARSVSRLVPARPLPKISWDESSGRSYMWQA